MINDRMTEHEDWKDGMNQFRTKVYRELEEILTELEKLKQKIGETP
jgi:SMC interacting uncharacterized protein involved in chromosome segregation|tara:strand:+ start:546 stop:683 length:138 start_codon:yes stop_codon:yes gene_type:complete